MASLAQAIFQQAAKTADKPGEAIATGVQQGAELALRKEQNEIAQQRIQQQKQNIDLNKARFILGAVNTLDKYAGDPSGMTAVSGVIDKAVAQVGGESLFEPQTLELLKKSATARAKLRTLSSKVESGEMTFAQALETANDPGKLADVQEAPTMFQEAQRQRLEREASIERARLTQEAQFKRQERRIEATTQEAQRKEAVAPIVALNKDFAKQAAKFKTGGMLKAQTNFKKIEGAIKKLQEPGELASSKVLANIPFVTDAAIENFAPELAAVRDDIRGAIQNTLRETLGAQFTEKEGKLIFDRAFNPRLSDAENIRRATIELNFLKQQVDSMRAAVEYFDANKTLEGFKGPIMSGEQLKASIQAGPDFSTGQTLKVDNREVDLTKLTDLVLKSKNPDQIVNQLSEKTGKSVEELKQLLGVK